MRSIAIRIAVMAAGLLIAAVLSLAVVAFLCIALYYGLQNVVAPWAAALLTAAALTLAALLVIAIAAAVARSASRKEEQRDPDVSRIGLELGRILGETAYRYASQNPTRVLVAAVVAGFAVGAVPRLRSLLLSFLRRR